VVFEFNFKISFKQHVTYVYLSNILLSSEITIKNP
jgi:hypothetical protein